MGFQIVILPVGYAHDLDPAEPVAQYLCIPAVSRIVSHLILHVLPEAKLLSRYACARKEPVGHSQAVSQELVCDRPFPHSLAYGHLLHLSCDLPRLGVKIENNACDILEFRMRLVPWIDEYLSLSLREFAQPYHALPGRYLVAVRFPYLRGSKWQMVAIEFQEAREIHEHALCSLRTEVPYPLCAWTYHGLEHEVELIDITGFSAALRAPDIVLIYDFGKLVCAQRIRVLHDILHEMICSESL